MLKHKLTLVWQNEQLQSHCAAQSGGYLCAWAACLCVLDVQRLDA